jgi:hypothetical protein
MGRRDELRALQTYGRVVGRSSRPVLTCEEAYVFLLAALDSAAKVTMSSTLVALFETTVGGSIQLERLLTSKASCDNATIDLIGEVAQTADVTFQ